MIPLPIHHRKAPNLIRRPSILRILHITLDMSLPTRSSILLLALQPAVLQERILGHIDGAPARLALEIAEDVVIVLALHPVEDPDLGRAFDAASCGLLDVDVCGAGFVVLFHIQGDGCETDGFTGEPADALEGEDGVGVVGEGFVLGVLEEVL